MLYPMGNPIGILIAGEAPSSLLFKHCLLTPGVLPNSWNGKYSPIGNTITGWHLDLNNSRRSSTLDFKQAFTCHDAITRRV